MCHGQMIFLLNNKPVDALALIVPRSAEQRVGKMWVKKLREWCPVSLVVVQNYTDIYTTVTQTKSFLVSCSRFPSRL